jgi:hypothetical protein
MSIISAIIGSVAASGGGSPSKTATWYGIDFEPVNEGQQNHAQVQFTNWDNSTVYWTVVGSGNSYIGGQLVSYNGTLNPGSGDSIQDIYFTFNADATTDGPLTYYVNIGSSVGNYDLTVGGPFTCRDTSQTPALVLDLDPANYSSGSPTVWPDTSGANHTGGIYNYNTSGEAGGTFVWNGTNTQSEVSSLNTSIYGTITLSAWIKPTAVIGSTQAIIAKELCYKLEITTNGSIAWMTAKGYNPWEITAYADPGLVTTSTWAQVVATVDADHTRIYVNGVKVTETTGNIIGANTSPFDIGMWQTTGSPSDFFGGLMGEVKVWNYALTAGDVTAQYNSTAARYGLSPVPGSLDFPGTGNPYLLVSNTQSDWNLGTTYTIEFWSKGGNASTGAIRTVASQGPANGIDLGFMNGGTLFRNTQNPGISEPTAGVWTHVAFVGNGGNTYVYHNGELKGTYTTPGALGDGSSDLNIGRRAGVNGQGFYGKLAMIRISNTAKYTSSFTPSYSYGVESDTRLMLGNDPTVDGTGNHPVSVQGAVTTSLDFPTYQSLVFNQPEGDYLSTPASADWNLGTTYTIEFWIKANHASGANINIPGGQWGLINQTGWYGGMQNNSILIGLSANNMTIAQDPNNEILFAEPTAGVWTHVAFVNNGGGSAQKLYYNGVEQTKVSGSYQSNGWTNSTDDLYIGRLAPNYASHFDGKMAMVRISNTAKYLTTFTPTATYGVEADTKLFLGKVNPTVDSKSHAITNNGVALISDFPVAPASITITNVSTSRNPGAVTTVDFTGNVSVSTTGTIFFAWDSSTAGPYTLTVNPGSNVYTSPGLGLVSTGHDLTTQITITSGPNTCTSNIFTSSWDVICLVEGTMITMADGSHKAIEEIKYTDLIRVWNFDLGEFSEALPIFVKREETYAKHYRFTFSDGIVLRTVGHHVFNKQAGEFTMLIRDTTPVGTITFNELGEEVTLISKEIIEEPVKFYNVWTQYHLNMFADGIMTSNRFNNIYPIRDMKFVKDTRALRPLEEFADIDPKYISGLRLQEQPKQYSAEYIKDYVDNKLVRLDVANTSKALS